MFRTLFPALGAVFAALLASGPASAAQPTVAVLTFQNGGSGGFGGFYGGGGGGTLVPGEALADLVTNRLVNAGLVSVVDRNHVDDVAHANNFNVFGYQPGANTTAETGRQLGARYLITGNIIQFDVLSQNSGSVGSLMSPILSGGSVTGNKVNLNVSVRVVEASTGRVVAAFNEERHDSGTSLTAQGLNNGGGYAAYTSQQFLSSSMGKLLNSAAVAIADRIDAKLSANAALSLSARIISISGEDIIINAGSARHVAPGMYFEVVKVMRVQDPDSGQMLTTHLERGRIQIISVDEQTSVAHRVSGEAALNEIVRSE
jgi:curli biogenesis system outer membrane secretion channel CsgG